MSASTPYRLVLMPEWSCGVCRLPVVTSRDPPVSLTAIFWVEQGQVRSFDVYEHPDRPLDGLAQSFEKAVTSPMFGSPGRPDRVRVASEPLARRIASVCGVEAIFDETPELEHVIAWLEQALRGPSLTARQSLETLPEEHRDSFVRAALDLFAQTPWVHCEPDIPLGVCAPSLGIDAGAISVMGHSGENLGFMLFKTVMDYELFLKLAESNQLDAGLLPYFFSLSYQVGSVGDAALPEATVFEGRGQRPPSVSELRLLVACAVGLTKFLHRNSAALRAAWRGEKAVKGQYKVRALGENHTVVIQAPTAR